MGMGIDREKLGCEISKIKGGEEGNVEDGEMVNVKVRLFRDQGSMIHSRDYTIQRIKLRSYILQ